MDAPHLFARPELAKHYLGLLLDRPQTALSLFGPRQIGKTTFITGDLSASALAMNIRPVYVDLMAASDKLEAINGALRDTLYTLKTRRSQERVRGVKALGLGVDLDAAPSAPASADGGQQLQHLVADVLRQPRVDRILLLLDEVQELAKSVNGAQAMKAVRAVVNRHKADGRVLLLMTGSSKEGLAQLFAAHAQPSFGLAERQDFPVLGRDYVEHVIARANETRSRNHKLRVDRIRRRLRRDGPSACRSGGLRRPRGDLQRRRRGGCGGCVSAQPLSGRPARTTLQCVDAAAAHPAGRDCRRRHRADRPEDGAHRHRPSWARRSLRAGFAKR